MTIYIPTIHELPRDQLSRLCPGATFSVIEADKAISAYVYEWPDLKITINVVPDAEVTDHLAGFIGWAESVARAQGRPLDMSLTVRIRSTTMVLGFVIEKATDRDVWHDRVQDVVGMICFNTGGLLFWEGAIFDEQCQQLLPTPA
jgi:hypothetical protein